MTMKPDFRLFNIILFSIFISLSLLALFTSYQIQPLVGDLTRVDWRSEQQFGWNGTEKGFEKPLFVENWQNHEPPAYDKYYDVVVIGDSFSNKDQHAQTPGGTYWQNWFVDQTELSLINFDMDTTSIDAVINSQGFKEHPPRLFIVESVERFLDTRLMAFNDTTNCQILNSVQHQPPLKTTPAGNPVVERQRDTARADFGYAFNYVLKQIKFSLWGERLNTHLLELSSDQQALSHNQREALLVINADVRAPWSEEILTAANCGATALSNKVQANGKTHFVLMVAPDKTTVYSQYAVNPTVKQISQLDQLLAGVSVNAPRIDKALKTAASPSEGIKDLYLPNDTHWGYRGHRLAAKTLTEYLEEQKILSRQ